MARASLAAVLAAAMAIGSSGRAAVSAQETPHLAGRWMLDRALSQSPREIGFGADWMTSAGSGEDSPGTGGRGRRGSSGGSAGAFAARPESAEDATRLRQLTAEVRNPTALLTITETPAAITIADDTGQVRTFHPDGKQEVLHLGELPLVATTKWEAGHLVVLYNVEEGRQLRYTYSRTADPAQLLVDVKFVERGGGDEVRRTYEPAGAADAARAAPTASTPTAPLAGLPSAAHASGDRVPPQTFTQGPDVELKGLTTLGVVVENLSSQAAACGLSQGTLETAVAQLLSDAGLKVIRNSDEDTYVYVNVITTRLASGLCVSRYDASLSTHTTTKLSYQETPVLVQVSLLHEGGIAGGAPAAHADGVVQGVKQYVGQFAARIRAANK
jgi:hypothetical protein